MFRGAGFFIAYRVGHFRGSRLRVLPSDGQEQVEENTHGRRGGDGRELHAEGRDHAVRETVTAAETDDDDDRDHREVPGVEHDDLFIDHDRRALRGDDAEEVYAGPVDDAG